jgi:hypothetical protein
MRSRPTPWPLVALALLAWAAGARPGAGAVGPDPARSGAVAPVGGPASDLRARPVATDDATPGGLLPGKDEQDGPDALDEPRATLAALRDFRPVVLGRPSSGLSVPSSYPLRC